MQNYTIIYNQKIDSGVSGSMKTLHFVPKILWVDKFLASIFEYLNCFIKITNEDKIKGP